MYLKLFTKIITVEKEINVLFFIPMSFLYTYFYNLYILELLLMVLKKSRNFKYSLMFQHDKATILQHVTLKLQIGW